MEKGKKLRLYIAVLIPFACGSFLTAVFRSINAVQGSYLISSLHISLAGLGWATSAYLLAFSLAQLPYGVLVDKYSIKLVQASFFMLAALGTILFAWSNSVGMLATGRFIIGIGVAGGLMGAYKANTIWFPKKVAMMNGIVTAAGGLGVAFATRPSQILIHLYGWRTFNLLVAGIIVLVAVLILALVPKKGQQKTSASFRKQAAELTDIFANKFFLRIAPTVSLTLGFFLAVQALWASHWLIDANKLSPRLVSICLFYVAIGFIIGSFLMGFWHFLAKRYQKSITQIMVIPILLSVVFQLLIIFRLVSPYISWFLYSIFAMGALLGYSEVSNHFPKEFSGRAITALNIAIFLTCFLIQILIGLVLHYWQNLFPNITLVNGYQFIFIVFLILQILAVIWLYPLLSSGSTSNHKTYLTEK